MRLLILLLGSICVTATMAIPSTAPSPPPTPGPPFEAGAICRNYTTFHQQKHLVLVGKHLTIGEFPLPDDRWPVWSHFNDTVWSGVDITLLDRMAAVLNFTYQIKRLSWRGEYDATLAECDLVLNYWDPSSQNTANFSSLRGHVDASRYLVTYKPVEKEESFTDHLQTVMKPFTLGLWATVVVLMVTSGLLMHVLEMGSGSVDFDQHHAWFHSQFLSFGLFTGAACHAPESICGRVFLLIHGLCVVVIVAAYTANLAGFLLQSSVLSHKVASISELQNQNQYTVCVQRYDMVRLGNLYPGLNMRVDNSNGWQASVASGYCDAWITPFVSVKNIYSQTDLCELTTIGSPLYQTAAGWKTNPLSHCVLVAVEYALDVMSETDEVGTIINAAFPQAKCSTPSASTSARLDVRDMSGLLVMYGVACVVACIAHVAPRSLSVALGLRAETEYEQEAEPSRDPWLDTEPLFQAMALVNSQQQKAMELLHTEQHSAMIAQQHAAIQNLTSAWRNKIDESTEVVNMPELSDLAQKEMGVFNDSTIAPESKCGGPCFSA